MTHDEAQQQGIPLHETKPSQHRRATWQEYSGRGLYMVTLCIADRRPLFGTLQGEARAARGTDAFPHIVLSALGKEVLEQEIPKIHAHYPQVEVWRVAMMPDHLHLLLYVREALPRGRKLGTVISGFMGGCSKAWWRQQGPMEGATSLHATVPNSTGTTAGTAPLSSAPSSSPSSPSSLASAALVPSSSASPSASPAPVPAPAASPSFPAPAAAPVPSAFSAPAPVPAAFAAVKTSGTAAMKQRQSEGLLPLFEEGYHDRIIRRPGMLENIKRYMDDNPLRAVIRRECKRLMERRLHLWVEGREYAAFGNLFLLRAPERVQVFFHRRDKDGRPTEETEGYAEARAQLLQMAEEGAVLVTPGISRGEAGVMNAALERGLPLIILQKEPIREYWKPAQQRFYACAAGKLLIMAPWQINASTDYGRFHFLNDLATEICSATQLRIMNYNELTEG